MSHYSPDSPSLEKLYESLSSELESLYHFLKNYQLIWSEEVLNNYPLTLSQYNNDWLKIISHLTIDQEWQVDCGKSIDDLPSSDLKTLLLKLQMFEKVPRWQGTEKVNYPSWAFFKVSGKKQHEIEKVVQTLPIFNLRPGDHFIDIGGGKGHLARILTLYHGLNGVTLDSNFEFQDLGVKRLHKYKKPQGHGQLEFILHTFGEESLISKEAEYFKNIQLSLGLHTCGPLALHHLSKLRDDQSLLNFGCCYQKMDIKTDVILSHFAKKYAPLSFTKHALTLATRGHTSITFKEYLLKKKVKRMRAGLHFFMIENGIQSGFVTVGSAPPRLYNLSFSEYVVTKLKEIGAQSFLNECSISDIENFWEKDDTQNKINEVYRACLIRWRFGRVLEKFIIYDRALSCIEKGFPVEVYQFFDEKISPRNIGLIKR